MEKKLLSILSLLFAFFLNTSLGFGQCPTSLSISANTGNNICAGTEITFTANPSPTGLQDLQYQWQLNSVDISGATSATYITSSLTNGSKIKVIATSSTETTCSKPSNELTMTVNAKVTPTVSVTASKTTICPGESVTFTAANTNGGTNPQYGFYLNNQSSALQTGSSNTYTTTTLNDGDQIKVVLTSNVSCVTSPTAETISNPITVRAGTPSVPGTIATSVGSEICPGTSQTYSVDAVAEATSYQWTLPSGWSGTSTTTSINVTAGTSNGSISVKAINDCGTSEARSLAITIKAGTPAVPGTITGTTAVCPGISETYSVAAVSGATEYIWSLPNGWTGTSSTNSINVSTGASGSGIISVQAKNECGTSTAKTLAVSVKPGTPATPGTISGTAAVCPGIQQTYSITNVTGATSYIWTLPNGWSGTSTTNSITATSGTSGGNITVKAINDCGTSSDQTIAVTVKPGTPATPSAISGSNSVCPNTSETFAVTNDTNALEYLWTLPNGWTGTSSTSSITVNTGSSGSGNITVKAKNDCGTSAASTFAVSVTAPAPVMSGVISGPAIVCSGNTSLVYTIPPIANAASYIWTLPGGWTGTSTTNSITTTAGASGNISVIAKNTCGDSASSTNFAVSAASGVPTTPGAITTNLPVEAICPPATGITFSVPTDSGATSYNWTLPTGWEITSGATTNAIVVRVNSSTATTNNASVSVKAVNVCGQSAAQTRSGIVIKSHVVTNIGADLTICKNRNPITINGTIDFGGKLKIDNVISTGTGSISSVPSGPVDTFTFFYTPSQNDIDTKSQVTITLTTQTPAGACGPGKDEMVIFIKPDPTASITGTSTICTGNATDITFSATPNTIVTFKRNSGADQTIAVGPSGTAVLSTGALTANTTYSLVSVKYAAAPDCPKTVTGSAIITITQKPTAAISYNASPYNKCITTGQLVSLTGTQSGVFSAPAGLSINSSTGTIIPSGSTAGTYTVTYTTPAAGGCTAVTATANVTIQDTPTMSLSYAGTPFCSNATTSRTPSLTGTGNYEGGTYSGSSGLVINSSTGIIGNNSPAGNYTVTYSISPSGSCAPITQTTSVVITENPVPIINYTTADFCKSVNTDQSVSITGVGNVTGGTFSAPTGLSLNSSSGAINPSLSTAGTYKVTYALVAANGCAATTAETFVNIIEIPNATINYSGPFCQADASSKAVSFSNTVGDYQNGTFSSTAGVNINATTGEILPSSSQSGSHTITYTIPAKGGCSPVVLTTTIEITPNPQATIAYAGPFCNSDASSYNVTFSNTAGAYQNGIFSGTNGLSLDAVTGSIIPSSSTTGLHTVTYTISSANGCPEVVSTTTIEIFEKVLITTQPSNLGICSTQPAAFNVVATGDNLTYQWFKDNVAINGATSASFNLNNATSTNAGNYNVVVTGANTCAPITSDVVTLNVDEDIIIIKPAEDITFCENDVTEITFEYIAHANGAELTFEWIKNNVVLSEGTKYTFERSGPTGATGEYSGKITINNLAVSDNGIYAVKIKGPDTFTCSEATSKTFTLSINDQPLAPITENITYCQGDVASALTATGTNLKWYATEFGDDFITGTPTPSTAAVGTTSYWVSQTPDKCESLRAKLDVIIKEKPAAPATTTSLSFCLNEVVTTPLEAVGDQGNTINWYSAVDSTTPLASAPVPNTSADVTTNFWVSQVKNGCESDRAQVTITINPLPNITASAAAPVICETTSTNLTATGAATYNWVVKGTTTSLGTSATLSVSPSTTTTYEVTGTNTSGCSGTAEVAVTVDLQSIGGTITPSTTSVCISGNSGTLSLAGSGYVGTIQRWESSINGGTSWTAIANTAETLSFTNLTQNTSYRAAIKNGTCAEVFSSISTITVDPLPIAGKLLFGGTDRIFLICENPASGNVASLHLIGASGTIAAIRYRKSSAPSWSTLPVLTQYPNTTEIVTALQIEGLTINETIIFQVEIKSGSCLPNVVTQTAILSVIPSDITPTPVTAEPGVVCLGEEVTLSSETGYETGGTILDQGAFDNASITNHGWRIRRNNNTTDLGFDSDANNTVFDRWKRATPRAFTTASINSPYSTSGVVFDTGIQDGNKGFALVSGKNSSTMETPVFTIGSMDQAVLTFDQAYVLTPGASLKVEISTDGGSTYTTLYIREVPPTATQGIASGNTTSFGTGTVETRPENKILIDLGDYMGRSNLRIRFNYSGTRSGDIWAVDNIDVPEGPRGITMEWRDYTDPDNVILIDTINTVQYAPKQIGLNIFEVKTILNYDSTGNACPVEENAEEVKVFVFDKYTTSVTAEYGSCGVFEAQLTGKIVNSAGVEISTIFGGEIVPTPDGYIGEWVMTGAELVDPNPGDNIPAKNDPSAKMITTTAGTYTVSWTLVPTARNESAQLYVNPAACPPVITPIEIILKDCIALDFDGINDYVDLGNTYTGSYSIEAWILPKETGGTIISGPNFHVTTPDGVSTTQWTHVAVSNGSLYLDGVIQSGVSITGNGGAKALIGATWAANGATDFFHGWIEEVRIWNNTISVENIRFTMNQRLKSTGNIGVEVDMDHPDSPDYSDLAGYYQLLATEADILPGGLTLDLANNNVNGKLMNMETLQENTAPLPYFTKLDGSWDTAETWARPTVWKIPNTNGVNWNIVRTLHNVNAPRDISVLGLISVANTLQMLGTIPADGSHLGVGTGNALTISHYLKLDGIIDLNGESQLLQPELSILVPESAGHLDRDQQGKRNSFIYNYWASPVSTTGSSNNGGYTVGGVLLDGTNSLTPPVGINFQAHHAAADGVRSNPITTSAYWLWKFSPATANAYSEWKHIGSTGPVNSGEGFTMKGTAGNAAMTDGQNYTFRGKPHNGNITLPNLSVNQNYLIGNPYPSAINAHEFIRDNLKDVPGGKNDRNVFDGSLYLWDHFQEVNHILKEYIGGYAVLNLGGSVPAASIDDRINNTGEPNDKRPGQYMPVAQGFMINSTTVESTAPITGGIVIFKNSQRSFVIEGTASSIFLKPETEEKTDKSTNSEFTKIRLSFSSPVGYWRQILVGAIPGTTDGFDLGYDAQLFDDNVEDMYFVQDDNFLVIQGVPHFNSDQVLPLGVKIKENKPFTIRIDTLENAPAGMKVYLKDKLNDSIHDLTSSAYNSTSEPGYIHDRFEIVFFKDEPPVVDPGEEIPGGEFVNLTITHAHDLRQIRIINPEEMSINGVYLFDLNGNLIDSYGNLPNEKEFKLNVASYATGVYLVKVYAQGKVITKKIIISN